MELLYRGLEGVSTGAMTMFVLMVTNPATQPFLILTYILHWCASFLYHVYRTKAAYNADITLIAIMQNERFIAVTPTLGPLLYVYAILASMFFPPSPYHHLEIIIKGTLGVMLSIYLNPEYVVVLPSFLMSGLLFYLSELALQKGQRCLGAIACVGYHLSLGVVSYLETDLCYSSSNSNSTITSFLRYTSWFFYLFHQVNKNMAVYRLQSVISLMAASLLAPIGLWESIVFFSGGNATSEWMRREVHVLYLAYVVADTYHGLRYYPQYFPLIEGWIHHSLTGLYVLYNLHVNNLRPVSLGMIVEVPSIILFASRVFYPRLKWLKKHVFPFLFCFFRIILLGVFTSACYVSNDIGYTVVLFYLVFSILNGYWILMMMSKKRD